MREGHGQHLKLAGRHMLRRRAVRFPLLSGTIAEGAAVYFPSAAPPIVLWTAAGSGAVILALTTVFDAVTNSAQRTASRKRPGAEAPRGKSTGEMGMDNHSIRAGWPFDRQVDFPLGEKIQLEAGAVGEEGGPGESPGGGTTDPGERMDDWRRIGWANEDNTAGWARVGRRLPTGGAPRVIDLDVSSGYPIVLGQVDGRTMIRWPLTVRERPPSPHRTMFMDEYHYDADGWLHRDDGPAIVFAGGARVWMQHGALHRAGGPAIEGDDGSSAWYRHGGRIESPE